MLLYFEGQLDLLALGFELADQGVVDAGQRVGKLNIDHRTMNFNDFSCIHISYLHGNWLAAHPQSDCPPAISSNSFVILPCRSLLYSRVMLRIKLSALSVAFFIDTKRALCSLAFAFNNA